jgi:hypothetical protein
MSDPTNTANPFTEQRKKWEVWLTERQAAKTLHEPLLVFVDDEEDQRTMRYYEMRQRKHPGRNILLFERADEAVEFLKFAIHKGLNIASVITDFDNGKASTTDGNQVLEQAIKYENRQNQEVVKLLISSIPRQLSENVIKFNSKLAARDPRRVEFLSKDDPHHIAGAAPTSPQQEPEKDAKLIPDLIYSMRVIDIVLNKFEKALEPYARIALEKLPTPESEDYAGIPLENEGKKIGEIYAPLTSVMQRTQTRVKDMLKIWALIKHYEFEAVSKGTPSPNPDSQEPEEPINIRILGAFFMDEFKRIQFEFAQCANQIRVLDFPEIVHVIKQNHPSPESNECRQEISKATHNLKQPLNAISGRVVAMARTLEDFLNSEHPNMLSSIPKEGEHRFTHQRLLDMVADYVEPRREAEQHLLFYYYPATHTAEKDVTRDRTTNTPGVKAPTRETIIIPFTEEERAQIPNKYPISGISTNILGRFLTCITLDMGIYNMLTTQSKNPDACMKELAQGLRNALEQIRQEPFSSQRL